jgi:predicted nucleic-acid-binding protein
MFAVDTNILLCIATHDDPHQLAIALDAIGETPLWISVTVLLETQWVLRSRYQWASEAIVAFFNNLLAVTTVQFEDENKVSLALSWVRQGADFADALHLARKPANSKLLSFDADFCKNVKLKNSQFRLLPAR